MYINEVWVRDPFDLLCGSLLAPARADKYGEAVSDDYEGEVVLYDRFVRNVFISAGTTCRAYGGPEEGGWWYDHFDTSFQFAATFDNEEALKTALDYITNLLIIQQPHEELRDLQVILYTDDFFVQRRPHYE